MKQVIVLVCLFALAVPVSSQDSHMSLELGATRGYSSFDIIGPSGASESSATGINTKLIYAYEFNPNLFLGLGLGINYLSEHVDTYPTTSTWKHLWLPVFLDLKKTFGRKNISPFVEFRAGQAWNLYEHNPWSMNDEDYIGGLYVNPMIGTSFILSNKTAINIGLAYELMKITVDWDLRSARVTRQADLHSINLVLQVQGVK